MSFCGLDFGTSNSAIGVVNDDEEKTYLNDHHCGYEITDVVLGR